MTPAFDLDQLAPPAYHPLNGERWRHGRTNGSTESRTFIDDANRFAIEVEDAGTVRFWHLGDGDPIRSDATTSGPTGAGDAAEDGATELARIANVETIDGVLALAAFFATRPERFVPLSAEPDMQSGPLPADYQSHHAMFYGRWADGTHSDAGYAYYEDHNSTYGAEFGTNNHDEFPWVARALRLNPDDADTTLGIALAPNETAVVGLLDVFMRYITAFDPDDTPA